MPEQVLIQSQWTSIEACYRKSMVSFYQHIYTVAYVFYKPLITNQRFSKNAVHSEGSHTHLPRWPPVWYSQTTLPRTDGPALYKEESHIPNSFPDQTVQLLSYTAALSVPCRSGSGICPRRPLACPCSIPAPWRGVGV